MVRKTLVLLLACLLVWISVAACAEELTVSVPETVKGYTPCEIVITSPVAGEAVLKLLDPMQNVWLTRKEQITEGENVLPWDGLGEFGDRMFAGPYRFLVKVTGPDGTELSAAAKFEISGTTQTLCFVSAECLVRMEVADKDGKVVFVKEEKIKDPDGICLNWSGTLDNKKKIPAGEYTVRMWSKLNPDYVCSFPLTVKNEAPEKLPVGPTGPVVPERGMSEEEIWEIMMKPSVVIDDNGTFRRFDLYSTPKVVKTRTVGTLRCALQGLEVLDADGTWAHVRAWRHEDGKPVEGYYMQKKLTVVKPSTHYGVLIDKRDQTLTLYQDGHAVGSVPVSTGLVEGIETYRETPAGAFLTDVHTGASFAQDGYRYEYPLRYDGGNYIHGVGYSRTSRVRDYSENQKNQKLLGQKASHGCTRVSVTLQEGCKFNIYWLWAHLPYHTRVIILDD